MGHLLSAVGLYVCFVLKPRRFLIDSTRCGSTGRVSRSMDKTIKKLVSFIRFRDVISVQLALTGLGPGLNCFRSDILSGDIIVMDDQCYMVFYGSEKADAIELSTEQTREWVELVKNIPEKYDYTTIYFYAGCFLRARNLLV